MSKSEIDSSFSDLQKAADAVVTRQQTWYAANYPEGKRTDYQKVTEEMVAKAETDPQAKEALDKAKAHNKEVYEHNIPISTEFHAEANEATLQIYEQLADLIGKAEEAGVPDKVNLDVKYMSKKGIDANAPEKTEKSDLDLLEIRGSIKLEEPGSDGEREQSFLITIPAVHVNQEVFFEAAKAGDIESGTVKEHRLDVQEFLRNNPQVEEMQKGTYEEVAKVAEEANNYLKDKFLNQSNEIDVNGATKDGQVAAVSEGVNQDLARGAVR